MPSVAGTNPVVLIESSSAAGKQPETHAEPQTPFAVPVTPYTGAGRTRTILSRPPGPSTPRVLPWRRHANRVAAATRAFEQFSVAEIRHAFAWSVGAARERQDEAIHQVTALRAALHEIEARFDEDARVIRDGMVLMSSLDNFGPRGTGSWQSHDRQGGLLLPSPMTYRSALAQLVYEQHALPCGHPDLVAWQEGTPVFGVPTPEPDESDEEDRDGDSEDEGLGQGQGQGSGLG